MDSLAAVVKQARIEREMSEAEFHEYRKADRHPYRFYTPEQFSAILLDIFEEQLRMAVPPEAQSPTHY